MPFMKGHAPIRRTLKYLETSRLVLKEKVQVVTVNYNTRGDHHEGVRDFVFWHLPQLQYKNPNIQIATLKNLTPTPFLRIFTEDGEDVLLDVDSKSRGEIHDHLKKVFCKSDAKLAKEAKEAKSMDNPANFGWGCERQCICEIPDRYLVRV